MVVLRRRNTCFFIVRDLAPCGVQLRRGLALQLLSRVFYRIISFFFFIPLEVRVGAIILCSLC